MNSLEFMSVWDVRLNMNKHMHRLAACPVNIIYDADRNLMTFLNRHVGVTQDVDIQIQLSTDPAGSHGMPAAVVSFQLQYPLDFLLRFRIGGMIGQIDKSFIQDLQGNNEYHDTDHNSGRPVSMTPAEKAGRSSGKNRYG